MSVWNADDVLLVIEVADETTIQDLTAKAALFGRAGYPVCWVVTPEAIDEHTGPTLTGYHPHKSGTCARAHDMPATAMATP